MVKNLEGKFKDIMNYIGLDIDDLQDMEAFKKAIDKKDTKIKMTSLREHLEENKVAGLVLENLKEDLDDIDVRDDFDRGRLSNFEEINENVENSPRLDDFNPRGFLSLKQQLGRKETFEGQLIQRYNIFFNEIEQINKTEGSEGLQDRISGNRGVFKTQGFSTDEINSLEQGRLPIRRTF
tara:strand:- start:47 stop:586 length:540 start_codon:yes stop_codon:yes gene_type:complete